ncbi:DUF21-domain-containing protein [Mollisia scopiformis]|uniref:DUF21-domain-containing protein n=1 Tax=Mollisia scopiformis TaxID=149040 RepID=A0A194WY43_MOLSC|nr:DUF21-domain-containing protein [Mollisia scopiformis]KUJ12517.1 DUF21-domain-containing protein [Mollisia scopiformis]
MNSNSAVAVGRSSSNGYNAHRPGSNGITKILLLVLAQITHVAAAPLKKYIHLLKLEEPEPAEGGGLVLYMSVALALVLLGGAFAGLTIALMGQDSIYLQVIAQSGEGKEQKHAQKVFNLLKKGKHWVLVTLLLSNVIVNETLPIVLDRSLGGGWPAVLGSTVLIVIFGEVIPQSICVRYGLSIGSYMAPCVLCLMWLMAPVAWPTAKLLDKLLGEDHGTVYKKSGLKTLVTLHKTLGSSPTERLNQDEVTIISAVLDLKEKAVGDIMTPMDDVFTMSADTVLDEHTMNIILSAGYSRIPIYEPGNEHNFVGMLLVKILITYDPEDCKKVSEFALATLPETRPETSCLDIVNFFQEGKSHMVLVSEFPGEDYGAIGVVTLEDVIEELIGEEIIDESDVYIDVHKAIRRMAPAPKARVQRGQFVTNPDAASLHAPEDHLIDLTEGEEPLIIRSRSRTSETRTDSMGLLGSSPKATFLRRSSSGGENATVSVRGNVHDMREHLKHLGPSNLASRPKTTRYNTVKIKSSTNKPIRSDSIVEEPYQDNPAPQGGEGAGLLKSAGQDAKDGVQAVQQGYGSFGPNGMSNLSQMITTDGASKSPTVKTSPRPWAFDRQPSQGSSRSSDTVGSLVSLGRTPSTRKKGPARSGSITETHIDSGGVRKVVLEANGTSGDERDGSGESSPTSGPSNPGPDSSPDDHDEQHEAGGETSKKKRRRVRRKKNNGNSTTEEGSTGQ